MSCPTRKQHANHVMFEVTVLHFKQITYTHYQTELDLTGCFITLSDSQTSDSTQLRRFLIGYCVSTRQLGQKRGRLDAIHRGQSGPDRADWKKNNPWWNRLATHVMFSICLYTWKEVVPDSTIRTTLAMMQPVIWPNNGSLRWTTTCRSSVEWFNNL